MKNIIRVDFLQKIKILFTLITLCVRVVVWSRQRVTYLHLKYFRRFIAWSAIPKKKQQRRLRRQNKREADSEYELSGKTQLTKCQIYEKQKKNVSGLYYRCLVFSVQGTTAHWLFNDSTEFGMSHHTHTYAGFGCLTNAGAGTTFNRYWDRSFIDIHKNQPREF